MRRYNLINLIELTQLSHLLDCSQYYYKINNAIKSLLILYNLYINMCGKNVYQKPAAIKRSSLLSLTKDF
jgi:hypothetical protein